MVLKFVSILPSLPLTAYLAKCPSDKAKKNIKLYPVYCRGS